MLQHCFFKSLCFIIYFILIHFVQNVASNDLLASLTGASSSICSWQKIRIGIKAEEADAKNWRSLEYAFNADHCGSLCMMNKPMFSPQPCGAYAFATALPMGGPNHNCYMYTSNADLSSFISIGPFDLYKRICNGDSTTKSPISLITNPLISPSPSLLLNPTMNMLPPTKHGVFYFSTNSPLNPTTSYSPLNPSPNPLTNPSPSLNPMTQTSPISSITNPLTNMPTNSSLNHMTFKPSLNPTTNPYNYSSINPTFNPATPNSPINQTINPLPYMSTTPSINSTTTKPLMSSPINSPTYQSMNPILNPTTIQSPISQTSNPLTNSSISPQINATTNSFIYSSTTQPLNSTTSKPIHALTSYPLPYTSTITPLYPSTKSPINYTTLQYPYTSTYSPLNPTTIKSPQSSVMYSTYLNCSFTPPPKICPTNPPMNDPTTVKTPMSLSTNPPFTFSSPKPPLIPTTTSVTNTSTTLPECSINEYRNLAIQLYQQYRQLLAQGKAPTKNGFLPTAKNYYQVNWDISLEAAAKTWADACNYAYQDGIPQTLTRGLAASPCDAIKKSFSYWTNMPVLNGADPDTYNIENAEWNRIANYRVLYFGCSTKLCGANYFTVCNFDKHAYSNQKVYETGPYCVANADCTLFLESTCKNGLCIAPPKPDETINTVCPSNPSMNDYARDQLVKWHNYYRALIIKGNEPAAGGRKAPKGKNMYKIKYNCAIEQSAQNHANTCPFPAFSFPDGRPLWGETLAKMSGGTIGENMAKFTGLQYSTLKSTGIKDLITNVINIHGDLDGLGYTQIVWGKTYEIGCGGKKCPDGYWHLVCQYNVAGNRNGSVVYEVATSGPGGCTTDADCTTQATDTCSTSDGLCNRV